MKTSKEIDDFLIGKLSEEESRKFREEIEKDVELATLVNLHKETNESISDDDIHEIREKIKLHLPSQKKGKSIVLRYISSVAAALLITFAVLSVLNKPDYGKAFTAFYQPYESDNVTRSEMNKTEGIDFAIQLYNKEEYQAAFEIFENYNETVYNNQNAQLFYGLCALELEKYAIAEENLLEVNQSEDPGLRLHSTWYLGLLYLKTEEPEKATKYLNELNTTENYYSRKVKKLLKKIK